jgi:hypothetical protein
MYLRKAGSEMFQSMNSATHYLAKITCLMIHRSISRTRNRPKIGRRYRIRLEELETRMVPTTVLDLSAPSPFAGTGPTFGTLNGAVIRFVSTPPATLASFLRVEHDGVEHGYNTNARPLAPDNTEVAGNGAESCRSIGIGSGAIVTNPAGVPGMYREYILDLRESPSGFASNNCISLDDLKLFQGDSDSLAGSGSGPIPSFGQHAFQIYDMEAGGAADTNAVALTDGNQHAAYAIDIPLSDYNNTTNPFVYLYCQLGSLTNYQSPYDLVTRP